MKDMLLNVLLMIAVIALIYAIYIVVAESELPLWLKFLILK